MQFWFPNYTAACEFMGVLQDEEIPCAFVGAEHSITAPVIVTPDPTWELVPSWASKYAAQFGGKQVH
jgi:hypothetical protein